MHVDYKNAFLNAAYGDDHTAEFPATVYLALFAADGVTEAVGGSYARVAVANTTDNFPPAADAMQENGDVIAFPEATASWGMMTYFKWMDAAVAGKEIHIGSLGAATLIDVGMTPIFQVGALIIHCLASEGP